MSYDSASYFIGDVKKFEVTTVKDSVNWSCTAVTLYLVDPDGNVDSYTATQDSTYVWSKTVSTAILDQRGDWRRYWTATDGVTTLTCGEVEFYVKQIE